MTYLLETVVQPLSKVFCARKKMAGNSTVAEEIPALPRTLKLETMKLSFNYLLSFPKQLF